MRYKYCLMGYKLRELSGKDLLDDSPLSTVCCSFHHVDTLPIEMDTKAHRFSFRFSLVVKKFGVL